MVDAPNLIVIYLIKNKVTHNIKTAVHEHAFLKNINLVMERTDYKRTFHGRNFNFPD